MHFRVSEKGQVTIPKRLRRSLGLTGGTELAFAERDGELVISKRGNSDRLQALAGILPGIDTDEFLDRARGPAWSARLDGRDRR